MAKRGRPKKQPGVKEPTPKAHVAPRRKFRCAECGAAVPEPPEGEALDELLCWECIEANLSAMSPDGDDDDF